MKKLHLLILLLFPAIGLFSQNTIDGFCETQASANAPRALSQISSQPLTTFNSPLYIRVYLNVITKLDGTGGQSNADILGALDKLNESFNPHNIFFVYFECSPNEIPVNDEDYNNFFLFNGPSGLFNNPLYNKDDGINIFIGPNISYSPELSSGGGGAAKDIVSNALWIAGVLNEGGVSNALNSPVIAHEMGHCLGLYHTFHGTLETDSESCCEFVFNYQENDTSFPDDPSIPNGINGEICGDFVIDTNADPVIWEMSSDCNTWQWVLGPNMNLGDCINMPQDQSELQDVWGVPFDPPIYNTMSYNVQEQCLQGFTNGQGSRMRNLITNNPILQATITTFECYNHSYTINPCLIDAAFTAGTNCDIVEFVAETYDDDLLYTWSFGDTNTGNGQTITHTYLDNGVYEVILTTSDYCGNTSEYIQEISIDCIVESSCDNCLTTIIDADQNWSNSGSIIESGNIVIEDGITLNIGPNVEVHFCEDATLTIKPGGTLNLYGKLTSCDTYWEGIRVEGDAINQYSYLSNKGLINLEEGAEIENAKTGVDLKDGAEIFADGGTFTNCRYSIFFHPYTNVHANPNLANQDYLSSVNNVDFIVDNSQPDFEEVVRAEFVMIFLDDVKNVKIRGCDFTDLKLNPNGREQIGIYSRNSGYTLDYLCTDPASPTYPPSPCASYEAGRNLFNNIENAIVNTPIISGIGKDINIYNSDFNFCTYGIKNFSNDQVSILHNDFVLGTNFYSTNTKIVGITLEDDQTGFNVEENDFTFGGLHIPYDHRIVGILCKNIGEDNDVIRRNTFTNIDYANLSNGLNGRIDPAFKGGLLYNCNNNYGIQRYDFVVPDEFIDATGDGLSNAGIHSIQALWDYSDPLNIKINEAGNIFSPSQQYQQYDFSYLNLDYLPLGMKYTCYQDGSAREPVVYEGIFLSDPDDDNTCPQTYFRPDETAPGGGNDNGGFGGFNIEDESETFMMHKEAWQGLRQTYFTSLNGESINDEIVLSNSSDAVTLLADLQTRAPFLSSTEVLSVIDKPDVISNSELFNLLLNNPDVIDNALLEILANKPNPLTLAQIDQLVASNQNANTELTSMKLAIDGHRYEMDRIGNRIVKHLKLSSDINKDDIHNWYENLETRHADYTLAFELLLDNEYYQMMELLNSMPDKYHLTDGASNDHTNVVTLCQILNSDLSTGNSLDQLSDVAMDYVKYYMDNENGYTKRIAEKVWRINTEDIDITFVVPEINHAPIKKRNSNKKETSKVYKATLYPNPTKDLVLMKYEVIDVDRPIHLNLMDVHGRSILSKTLSSEGEEILDVSKVKAGVYFYKIYTDTQNIATGKLLIQK